MSGNGASIGSKKAAQAARSRAALLGAAAALFAERGYRDTSVQAIGERAGVSRGSIFWHFGSKEGLLWAVVDRAFSEWLADVLAPDVGEARGVEAARRAVRAHRRILADRTHELRLFFVLMFEALGPRPELAAEFARVHAGLREQTIGWMAGDPSLRDDVEPESVIVIVTAALGGIAYQHLLDPQALDLDRVYADLDALVVRGLSA